MEKGYQIEIERMSKELRWFNRKIVSVELDFSKTLNSQNKLLVEILESQVETNKAFKMLSDDIIPLKVEYFNISEMKYQLKDFKRVMFVIKYGWVIAGTSFMFCVGLTTFLLKKIIEINPTLLKMMAN